MVDLGEPERKNQVRSVITNDDIDQHLVLLVLDSCGTHSDLCSGHGAYGEICIRFVI